MIITHGMARAGCEKSFSVEKLSPWILRPVLVICYSALKGVGRGRGSDKWGGGLSLFFSSSPILTAGGLLLVVFAQICSLSTTLSLWIRLFLFLGGGVGWRF